MYNSGNNLMPKWNKYYSTDVLSRLKYEILNVPGKMGKEILTSKEETETRANLILKNYCLENYRPGESISKIAFAVVVGYNIYDLIIN